LDIKQLVEEELHFQVSSEFVRTGFVKQ